MKVVIFGNSGAGKSTLAAKMASVHQLAHMDLDTVAWLPSSPPERMPVAQSYAQISAFLQQHTQWVIEGCYADLLALVMDEASEVIYLNLPIESCVANAQARPWEPHKYASKAAQDANLAMLIDWIKHYETRHDSFSKAAHADLFNRFNGPKTEYTSNTHAV